MHWNNSQSISHGTHLFIASILTIVMIAGLVTNANAYQRKPIYEDFTSTTCPPCASFAPTQERALQQMENQVSVVAYHMSWPAPGNDPWYLDNRADNDGRRGYYGVNSIPYVYIDGVYYNGARTEAAVVNALRTAANVAAPIRLTVTGRIIGGELRTTIRAESEQAINGVQLYICLTEIQAHYEGPIQGWNEHYDPMVKMIPNSGGTRINVSPNQPYENEFTQSMDGLGWHELEIDNLYIVAFVQNSDRAILQSETFQLGIDSPAIEILDWSITDELEGDGDTRPEPGETAHVTFNMQNAANYLPAETVDVTLTTDDEDISIVAGEFHLDGLQNGDYANNNDAPFRFTVADDFVAHPVTFTLSLTATPGEYAIEQDITLMIDWPPFLLVDAANNLNASRHLRESFGRDEVPWYDVWDRNEAGPMVDDVLIEQYEVVFWHTMNNSSDAIIDFEADVLTGYLDNGGTLVMSSAYLPGQIGNHALFTQYLGAEVDMANAGGSINYIRGVENDPHFGGAYMFMGGVYGFPNSRMSFRTTGGSRAVLNYENSGRAFSGIAAIAHETDTYRTLLLGFPLETINGTLRGSDSLITFTGRIWNWVLNEQDVSPGDGISPAKFALEPAFPNPFNASTVINFSVPRSGTASLSLFDVAGREIATLFSGDVAVGSHSATLNARELGLESGIYYVRLEAAGEKTASKVVYLK